MKVRLRGRDLALIPCDSMRPKNGIKDVSDGVTTANVIVVNAGIACVYADLRHIYACDSCI